MHKLYKEYKASLKDISVEEMVDLFFSGHCFCNSKINLSVSITPNQVSVLSMAAGIVSGLFYVHG